MRLKIEGHNLKEKLYNYVRTRFNEDWFEEDIVISGFTSKKEPKFIGGYNAYYVIAILKDDSTAILRIGAVGGMVYDQAHGNKDEVPKLYSEITEWCEKWNIEISQLDV